MALLNGFCQYKVYKKSGRKPKQPGTGPVVTVFVRDEVAGDKGKIPKRLGKFFDYIGLEGITLEEKSRLFVNLAKNEGNVWIFNNILKFMQFQLDRFNKKEIKLNRQSWRAIPIITMSKRFSERTSLCSWGCVGVAG